MDSGSKDAAQGNAAYRNAAKRNGIIYTDYCVCGILSVYFIMSLFPLNTVFDILFTAAMKFSNDRVTNLTTVFYIQLI